jgi:hypothetical protein
MAFDIRGQCSTCSFEGARVESWDDDVLVETTCRVCASSPHGGAPGSRDATRAALESWARVEGLRDAQELVDVYFVLTNVDAVLDAHGRGEPVETTFDVADYLFSGGAGGTGGEAAVMRAEDEEKPPNTMRIPPPPSIQRYGTAYDELLAIAAVAAADGEAGEDDLGFLERAAEKRQIPPLASDVIHVRRPTEIDPPPTLDARERVLEEMFQMAMSDGQMDESEMRVIRGFSMAWGIDPERLREWTELYSFGDLGKFERWFRRIGLFLFPPR